ncbi:MAG: RNA polymerase sigma factor [Woeseiaceae bacterium]
MADAAQTEVLFREHHECLTRFAEHLVGTGADADDLVQETFLRAHRYLCGGQDIHAPLSFLFVTMRNLVNDANRRKKLALVETSLDTDEIAPEEHEPSVERQAMSERDFENLCVAIAQLPERMRHAFVLRKVYGYSCREIAEQLGRSTNTVRDQVAQSFKKLHAFQSCGDANDGKSQSRTKDKQESSKARENDHPCPFRLASLANRESSG